MKSAERYDRVGELLVAALDRPVAERGPFLEEACGGDALLRREVETLRQEQMKVSDAGSKRFTQALTDAGDVLNVQQRQAFFKKWSDRGERHHKRG